MSDELIKRLLRDFFELLDKTEESDEGRVFHPVQISCCREQDRLRLNETLIKLKRYTNG